MDESKTSYIWVAKKRPLSRRASTGPRYRKIRRASAGRVARVPLPMHFGDQPMRKFVKLKYVEHYAPACPAANAIVEIPFRANGMHDPYHAVGGHQPYGYDQLMNMYLKYHVYRSVCTVEIISVATNVDVATCIAVSPSATTITDAYNGGGGAAAGNNTVNELPIISGTMLRTSYHYKPGYRSVRAVADIPKLSGKTLQGVFADETLSGTSGVDPTAQFFFNIGMYSPTAADISGSTNPMKITIVYYAQFSEPKYFVPS